MHFDQKRQSKVLQPGDAICWDKHAHTIWFEDADGNSLRLTQGIAGVYKFAIPFIRTGQDFLWLAVIIAEACGFTAAWSTEVIQETVSNPITIRFTR